MNRRSFIKGLALVPCLGFLGGNVSDKQIVIEPMTATEGMRRNREVFDKFLHDYHESLRRAFVTDLFESLANN